MEGKNDSNFDEKEPIKPFRITVDVENMLKFDVFDVNFEEKEAIALYIQV